MIRLPTFFRFLLWLALATVLLACEAEKKQETEFTRQQGLFLQSLERIESAGSALQSAELSQGDIELAMTQMDQGLQLAFQVDPEFLKRLDVRLPRQYTQMFIQGVEDYRIGVESSDRQKQLDGLNLLSQWGRFWLAENKNIQHRLLELNGPIE